MAIDKLDFNPSYHTFTSILLTKIVLYSEFPFTKFMHYKRFEMSTSLILFSISALSSSPYLGIGFRVQSLGFRVWGLGFRVWGLRFRVQGVGFGSGFRFSGFSIRLWGVGFRA